MLTDATAIGLSLIAIRLAQRPARGAMTFGLKRTEILSAWGYNLNGSLIGELPRLFADRKDPPIELRTLRPRRWMCAFRA